MGGGGGYGFNCRGVQLPALVLCEYIWKGAAVSLVLSTFDDNSSLGPPPRQLVYPPV